MGRAKTRIDKSALFLILILVMLIAVGGFLVASLQTDPVASMLENDEIIKILFVFKDGKRALSTDVLFYYAPFERGALFNIPGNTGAIYASLDRTARIDTVFAEKGIRVYHQEIESLLNQTIPFTIEISLDALCELTDLLGGLRVFAPYPVDAVGPQGDHWLLPSGSMMLDGDKIRTYSTYSLPTENSADIQERRQNVMLALFGALNENIPLINNKDTFRRLYRLFDTELDRDALQHLLSEIADMNAGSLVPKSISGSNREVDGQILLFPLYDGRFIKEIVSQTVSALVSPEETQYSRVYVLEIQNGTAVQGLAHNTRVLFESAGYDVPSAINAYTSDFDKTVIINHIGNDEVAKNIGNFIHCTNIRVDEVKNEDAGTDAAAQVDFTIILGRDFDGRYVR